MTQGDIDRAWVADMTAGLDAADAALIAFRYQVVVAYAYEASAMQRDGWEDGLPGWWLGSRHAWVRALVALLTWGLL